MTPPTLPPNRLPRRGIAPFDLSLWPVEWFKCDWRIGKLEAPDTVNSAWRSRGRCMGLLCRQPDRSHLAEAQAAPTACEHLRVRQCPGRTLRGSCTWSNAAMTL